MLVKEISYTMGPDEYHHLTKNAIEEASIDGLVGMSAVTTVVLNRLIRANFPNEIKKIVYQPYAFSWTLEERKLYRRKEYYGRHWDPAYDNVITTVHRWINNHDYLTGGATHYVRSDWVREDGTVRGWPNMYLMFNRGTIGSHTFFEERPIVKPDKKKRPPIQ